MPAQPAGPLSAEAAQTVGLAIQKLTAARLGRAFVPLALLFLLGAGRMLSGAGGFLLAAGAPLAAGAMLAYGLRVVRRAFGRPSRPWMSLAVAVAVIPFAFGVWVLGWLGLNAFAAGTGTVSAASGIVHAALGGWVLRAWLQILELDRLAETMAIGLSGER